MSGLFATLNVSKRGMFVQQKAIDVTSHNISNANTPGFSRQRPVIETTRPAGMPSLRSAAEPGQLGTGAQVTTIERIRDQFMDYQIRKETSTLGQYDSKYKYLSEVESILNEPGDTGISSLIGKFFDAWQQVTKQPQAARTEVLQQASSLAKELNHNYSQLIKLKENAQSSIQASIFEGNKILDQIDELNQQIRAVKLAGKEPNDLMDKRDLLLDELSYKFNYNIDKNKFYGNDITPIDIGALDPSQAYIVKSENHDDVKRFSYVKAIEQVDKTKDPAIAQDYKVTYYKCGDLSTEDNAVSVTINMTEAQRNELDKCRMIWADNKGVSIKSDGSANPTTGSINYGDLLLFKPTSGQLQGAMAVQKDIEDYTEQLNKLAKALAFSINAVHSYNGADQAKDDMPFFVNGDVASYDGNHLMTNLGDIINGEQKITAGNISVNEELLYDVMKLHVGKTADAGESDTTRAVVIAGLRDSLIKIQDMNKTVIERSDLKAQNSISNDGMTFVSNIEGMKFDNYYKDTIDRLGVQSQNAKRTIKNQEALLGSFNEIKESVSGVSLDEEMANLVQFQHAYSANAKVISTVDELLDVVINGLKR